MAGVAPIDLLRSKPNAKKQNFPAMRTWLQGSFCCCRGVYEALRRHRFWCEMTFSKKDMIGTCHLYMLQLWILSLFLRRRATKANKGDWWAESRSHFWPWQRQRHHFTYPPRALNLPWCQPFICTLSASGISQSCPISVLLRVRPQLNWSLAFRSRRRGYAIKRPPACKRLQEPAPYAR